MARRNPSLTLVPLAGAKPTPPARRPPPREYVWSEAEREEKSARHWQLARHLAEEGHFARIWNDGSQRGCPTASCLLPVLTLHAWIAQKGDEWTPWVPLSLRRVAALSGVNKNCVRPGLSRLESLSLIETRIGSALERDGGLGRSEYRLHRSLFPRSERDPFFRLTGALVYGGVLAMLPRASARHLLMIVAALDPIYDEAGLRGMIEADDDGRDVDATIRRRRADCRTTLARLVELSGMAASTVQEAVSILTQPIFEKNTIALVLRATGTHGQYYHVNHKALGTFWMPWVLNSRAEREKITRERWGSVLRIAA